MRRAQTSTGYGKGATSILALHATDLCPMLQLPRARVVFSFSKGMAPLLGSLRPQRSRRGMTLATDPAPASRALSGDCSEE